MLGDRRYYRESQSQVMNVFDCGAEKNSSHFTALRVLKLLLGHRGESTQEGQGYFPIGNAIGLFEDIFDNREDLIRTLDRLVVRQLVETNTRSTESISDATHVRVTSAGWYYVRHLVPSFAYLDLVLQDTPLNDVGIEVELRGSVYRVDNLSDRDEEKLERMEARFGRVSRFIEYLRLEEEEESRRYGLTDQDSVITDLIIPNMQAEYETQRERITRRLRENRERFQEDIVSVPSGDPDAILPGENEQEDDGITTSQ